MGHEEIKMSHMSEKQIDEMNRVNEKAIELNDLRAENAVLRGCEEILKKRIALLEAKCEFLSKGDAEKYQKTMEELTKGGWRTGSTEHFLGLTEEEVDTIDGWMEDRKTKKDE